MLSKINGKYVSFTSEEKFLSYNRTKQRYAEHCNPDEIAQQFYRVLKRKDARESIQTLGFNTKKFTKSESNRIIIAKELLAVLKNLQFFNEQLLGNRVIVITDSLPSKFLIDKSKIKDLFMFDTMVKLMEEFPLAGISYQAGSKKITDLFSRPVGDEEPILDFETSHLPRLIDNKHFFFNKFEDWLKCRQLEKELEACDPKRLKEQGISNEKLVKNTSRISDKKKSRVDKTSLPEFEPKGSSSTLGHISLQDKFNRHNILNAYT